MHPMFMPTYGMLLVFQTNFIRGFNQFSTQQDLSDAKTIIWTVFVGTAILPVLIAIVLRKLGVISSIQMPKREERLLPFILTAFCYFGVYYYLISYLVLPVNPILEYFMREAIFAILIAMSISFYYKVSVHMLGIGGIVGIIILISYLSKTVFLSELILTIFCAGLIGFSRLKLKAHTPLQVILGFSIGVFTEILGLFFN